MIYHEKKQTLQLLSQFLACHFPFALGSRFIPYIWRINPSSFNLPIWPQGLAPLCSEYLVCLPRVVPPCLLPWWGSPRRCRLPLSPEIEGSITVLLLFRLLEASKAYCSALFNTAITALLSSFSHNAVDTRRKVEESLYSWCISLYTSLCTNKCFVVEITLLTYPSIQNCDTCFLVSIFLLYSVSYLCFIWSSHNPKVFVIFPTQPSSPFLYMIHKDALCYLSQQTPCPCCMILIFRDQRTNSISPLTI